MALDKGCTASPSEDGGHPLNSVRKQPTTQTAHVSTGLEHLIDEFEKRMHINNKSRCCNTCFAVGRQCLCEYKTTIAPQIMQILNNARRPFQYEPTIFGSDNTKYIESLQTAFEIRQRQMKEGDIAQVCIGAFYGWKNLGVGHPTGLDCMKCDNSVIMELKNKYNTCNSSSQKTLLDKLAKYKKNNPNTLCVWGIVNPKPNCTKLTDTIVHNGMVIKKIQGADLFKLVFVLDGCDCSQDVIQYIKDTICN